MVNIGDYLLITDTKYILKIVTINYIDNKISFCYIKPITFKEFNIFSGSYDIIIQGIRDNTIEILGNPSQNDSLRLLYG